MRICLYYLGTRGEESVAGRIYDVEQVFIAINVVRNSYLWRQFTNGVNWRHKWLFFFSCEKLGATTLNERQGRK